MTAAVDVEEMRYTTVELCRLTGATYKQLDHWSRTGRLDPTVPAHGQGSRRQFSAVDLHTVHTAVAMLNAGFTLDAAFNIAAHVVETNSYIAQLADIYELTIAVRDGQPESQES